MCTRNLKLQAIIETNDTDAAQVLLSDLGAHVDLCQCASCQEFLSAYDQLNDAGLVIDPYAKFIIEAKSQMPN